MTEYISWLFLSSNGYKEKDKTLDLQLWRHICLYHVHKAIEITSKYQYFNNRIYELKANFITMHIIYFFVHYDSVNN